MIFLCRRCIIKFGVNQATIYVVFFFSYKDQRWFQNIKLIRRVVRGFDHWSGSLSYVLGQDTFPHSASFHPCITNGNRRMLGVTQQWTSIPFRIRDKFRLYRKLGQTQTFITLPYIEESIILKLFTSYCLIKGESETSFFLQNGNRDR